MRTAVNEPHQLRPPSPVNRTQKSAGLSPAVFRQLRGAAAFLVAAFVVVALRKTGALQGIPALVLAGCLVLLLPTAGKLSQRLLFNGLIVAGFVPLTWWLPERLVGIDHGTILLAIGTGLICWWIFSARSFPIRIRRLIPKAQWIDSVPFLAAALSALSLSTLLSIRASVDALSILTSRWDFQSHFSIYYMIRTHGEVIPTIPRGSSGEAWGFAEYPQGFHALLATASDLVRPVLTGLESELVGFINLQAAAVVLTVLIVIAGLCALPAVRRKPAVMATGVAVASGAWIYGPGSIPVYEGFANFYLACGMATATVLALLTLPRRIPLIGIAAVGAGLVSICNNWLLLVSLVAVALAIRLWSLVRQHNAYNRVWWVLASGFTMASILGMALPIIQISPLIEQGQHILEAQGGIAFPDFGLALVTVVLALVLGFANRNLASRTSSQLLRAERLNISRAALGLFIPVVVCIWLAVTQSIQNGTISYYFYKYLVALLLLAWPVAVAAAASLLPLRDPRESEPRKGGLVPALCVLAVTATQVFGFSVPGMAPLGLPPTASPLLEMSKQQALLQSIPPFVPRLLQSAQQPQPASTVYIPGPNTVDPLLAARWQWGMRGNSSSMTTALSSPLSEIAKNYAQAPQIIAEILTSNPGMVAIVDPEIYGPVRNLLASLGLEGRLIELGQQPTG